VAATLAAALHHFRFEFGSVTLAEEDATMQKVAVAFAIALGASALGVASQQFPVVDAVASKIVQKYQSSTCDQLWQERSQGRGSQPKSPHEQQAIQMLQNNPQMRAEFINRVAAPIANKMFECGMIP
jgi:thioesterase domain-containing protein